MCCISIYNTQYNTTNINPVHTNGIISVTQKLKLNRINSSINYILINDTHQSQIKKRSENSVDYATILDLFNSMPNINVCHQEHTRLYYTMIQSDAHNVYGIGCVDKQRYFIFIAPHFHIVRNK